MVGTARRPEIIYSLLDELVRLQRQRPMSGLGQSMISSRLSLRVALIEQRAFAAAAKKLATCRAVTNCRSKIS